MSRKKHAVKKNAWDGLSLLERWRLAQYGDSAENKENWEEAANLFNALQIAFKLEEGFDSAEARELSPGIYDKGKFQEFATLRRNRAWVRLKKTFLEAIEKGNGEVFATMAVIIERLKRPVDPAQTFIGHDLQMRFQRHLDPAPIQEMVDKLRVMKIHTSYNQVKRIYGYFGVKPSPGKPGHPKKASQ